MLRLKLHFLIDFELFVVRDRGVSHKFVLPSEINVMLVQFAIIIPQQTFNFVGAELCLISIHVLCILRRGLLQPHGSLEFIIKVNRSADR